MWFKDKKIRKIKEDIAFYKGECEVLEAICQQTSHRHIDRQRLIESKALLRKYEERLKHLVVQTDIEEGKVQKGGVNKRPTQPPPTQPPQGQGGQGDTVLHGRWSASSFGMEPDVTGKYYDLLFAVERVFPDETRHETALRYIREAESREHGCGANTEKQTNNTSHDDDSVIGPLIHEAYTNKEK